MFNIGLIYFWHSPFRILYYKQGDSQEKSYEGNPNAMWKIWEAYSCFMYGSPFLLSSTDLSSAVEAKPEYYLSWSIKRKVILKHQQSWFCSEVCVAPVTALGLHCTSILSRLPSHEAVRAGEDFSVPRQVCKVSLKGPEYIFTAWHFRMWHFMTAELSKQFIWSFW